MRKMLLRLVVLAAGVLTFGACADSPTHPGSQRAPDLAPGGPMPDQQVQGCVTDGVCILDPVIVDPGECDPWESLDWCSGDCITSVLQPLDQSLQSCPGDGGGGAPGDGTPPPPSEPGTACPTADDGSTCIPEEESTICPSNFLGNTQPTLINIAGRNHEFQFSSSFTYPFVLKSAARSPAIYEISFPATSKDGWWIARAGTITVFCRGVYISRSRHWVGIVTVLGSDLHMVMGPGHPDF